MRHLRKLLGFRSGKPWKSLVAGAYYLLALAVLIFGLFSRMPVSGGSQDAAIYRGEVLILFLWMLSPAIFLSDTPYRQYLPLFRKRTRSWSLTGMMIVFLFFAYLFASVDSLHTPAYRQASESLYGAMFGLTPGA